MPEPRVPSEDAAALPARTADAQPALPDGGRRTVVVSPDEVWGAPEPAVHAPAPKAVLREARRSFFEPILTVLVISTGLLLLFMAALALLVWLRR